MNEAKFYEKLFVKFIPGATPEIFFLNANGDTIEKMPISHMDTPSLHQLLTSKGIFKNKEL